MNQAMKLIGAPRKLSLVQGVASAPYLLDPALQPRAAIMKDTRDPCA